MKRQWGIVIGVITIVVAFGFQASARARDTVQSKTEKLIADNDENGDGKLSLDEFPESKRSAPPGRGLGRLR